MSKQNKVESKVLGQVKMRPHFIRGKPAGLRTTSIKTGSVFSRMGIANGDILMSVDGAAIKSPNDIVGLYEKLRTSSAVNLEIKRRNRTQTITYFIE